MLFEALKSYVLRVGHSRSSNRVEHLLLDCGVDRQLLDDPVDDLTLFDMGAITRLLELLEELLDSSMIGAQEGDGVHDRSIPGSRGT